MWSAVIKYILINWLTGECEYKDEITPNSFAISYYHSQRTGSIQTGDVPVSRSCKSIRNNTHTTYFLQNQKQ